MSRRTIYLPAIERRVSLAAYVAAIKAAKAQPEQTFRHGLTTWWPTTGREILDQFRDGVQNRINQAIPNHRRRTGGRIYARRAAGRICARRAIEASLDNLIEQVAEMPDGPRKEELNRRINQLDELLLAGNL